jgi:hypothetical protein
MPTFVDKELQAKLLKEMQELYEKRGKIEEDIRALETKSPLYRKFLRGSYCSGRLPPDTPAGSCAATHLLIHPHRIIFSVVF